MEKKWAEILDEEFKKPYMKGLQDFLADEISNGHTIYPPKNLFFNAFCQTPFDEVKVVIIGQDPYHGKGQAHGLSFSVLDNVAVPPSLKNIYKEQIEDVDIKMPKIGNLSSWAKQGVLLLNATLSVRASQPKSHYGKGWELFTDRVVEILSNRQDSIVFLLWGKSAQEKIQRILKDRQNVNHLVLSAAHPSFYSVANFFGCRHFSKTNAFLKRKGKEPIDWQIH